MMCLWIGDDVVLVEKKSWRGRGYDQSWTKIGHNIDTFHPYPRYPL